MLPEYEESDVVRFSAEYENRSQKFLLRDKAYIKQFFSFYMSRLEKVAESVTDAAKDKWGSDVPIKKLADLREDENDRCILVGTLYKQQKLKPSILREISDENHVAPQPTTIFYDDSDKVILEDGLNRIALSGKIDASKLVTGIVCALLGYEQENGQFVVEDQVFYSPGPQSPLPSLNVAPLLVILSGLDQESSDDFSLSMELFQQWVFGNISMPDGSTDDEAASICRIIVAGNSVRGKPAIRSKNLKTQVPESMDILAPLKKLDSFLSNLCSSVNVDLMPGEFDPANHLMPQQPMHCCMFPEVTQQNSYSGVANPYSLAIEQRYILGTSGQNVRDIAKFADLTPMEALRSTLNWGHIAPTCPDTLPSYPFTDTDPFVLDAYPQVYFAGNCSTFQTELFEVGDSVQTRLVCVPRFSETQSVAVVNLVNLDCYEVSFKVDSLDSEE